MHAYPAGVAEAARARWRELAAMPDPGVCDPHKAVLPDAAEFERLLSIAYQASLLQEEERPVRFRLFVGEPGQLPSRMGPPEGLHVLRFQEPRRFDEHEIRRLAPAAKFTRALIGVRSVGPMKFEIWGMLQSGPRWLQSARGGRPIPSPVPRDAVVIRAAGPGRISVLLGEVTLAELRGGQLQTSTMDAFESKWLGARFVRLREELFLQHEEMMRGRGGVPLDRNVPRKIAQQMIKRLIATMRDAHHGGTLLLVPRAHAAQLTSEKGAIRVKYGFVDDEPRRRYRSLILDVMRELSLAGEALNPRPEKIGWSQYRASTQPSIVALDESILEMSQLLAALGEVDGAVLLTDGFEVLGFGGEIAALSEIRNVRRALDLEADTYESVAIDSVGTRHRSAYRLCAHEPEAVAIVVSHDGGVQFVACREGVPTYWEHIPVTGAEV